MKNGGGARGFFCSRPPQTVRENDVKRKSASHVAETGKASKAAVKEGYFVNKVSGTLFLRHAQLVRDGSGQIVGAIPEVSGTVLSAGSMSRRMSRDAPPKRSSR